MKWLVFTTLSLWFYLLFQALTWRRRKLQARIDDFALKAADRRRTQRSIQGPKRNGVSNKPGVWLKLLAARVASKRQNLLSAGRLEKLQSKLAQAGNPMSLTAQEWIGFRFVTASLGALMGALFLWLSGPSLSGLLLVLCCLLLGFIGPEFWLSRKVKLREAVLMRQLPSVLDLLTVSVEAGLGFDQAMGRVTTHIKGPLAEEFDRALREIRLGSNRSEALVRMAHRTGVDAVRTFVSAVVQADRLGIGMAQVLRVQSAEVRRKRKMDASERAMKAPVKMLFPLVFFVFPALFIAILGPAVLHILQVLGHSR